MVVTLKGMGAPVAKTPEPSEGVGNFRWISGRRTPTGIIARCLITSSWLASDPLFVAPDADDKELERMRLAVEKSLNTATARAYALAQSGSSHAVRVRPDTAPRGMSRW